MSIDVSYTLLTHKAGLLVLFTAVYIYALERPSCHSNNFKYKITRLADPSYSIIHRFDRPNCPSNSFIYP